MVYNSQLEQWIMPKFSCCAFERPPEKSEPFRSRKPAQNGTVHLMATDSLSEESEEGK